jgi:hypothetical protein
VSFPAGPELKRQSAILGETPEFVRWSVRFACPIRDDLDLASVDQTWKRLRAIKVGAEALATCPVSEGIALSRDKQGSWLGFRIEDVFGPWGGTGQVAALCGHCPAVPGLSDEKELKRMAGCHGWLGAEGSVRRFHEATDAAWHDSALEVPFQTRPHWYSLWLGGELAGDRLFATARLFRQIECLPGFEDLRTEAGEFANVLENAGSKNLVVDVELIPPGFSDGLVWTIAACCDPCRAPIRKGVSLARYQCDACGNRGGVCPERRRKVLGLRPWVRLETVVGAANVEPFLQRSGLLK